MITIWRYLITSYLKIFVLIITVFIALLFIRKLEEIANFIALGTTLPTLLRFIGYQIPYILPFATAIASLVAAFSLFHRLSTSGELTALRFSGLSLHFIATPILLLAALFSCAGFYLTSECATTSHLKTRKMVYDLTSINPLLLLTSTHIPKLKQAYIQMEPTLQGKSANNLFIAFFDKKTKHINYILADKIEIDDKQLTTQNLAFIGSTEDLLIIENQEYTKSSAKELAHILSSKGWKIANDHLNLKLLRLRKQEYKTLLHNKDATLQAKKEYIKKIEKCDAELLRRASIALAPFTFTLLGIALGIHISRRQSKTRLLLAAFLAMITLVNFFIAKKLSAHFYIAATLFLLPHCIIVLLSWRAFNHINRGIE